jgi:hypothetical protein
MEEIDKESEDVEFYTESEYEKCKENFLDSQSEEEDDEDDDEDGDEGDENFFDNTFTFVKYEPPSTEHLDRACYGCIVVLFVIFFCIPTFIFGDSNFTKEM